MLITERKALNLDTVGKTGRVIAKEFSQKLGMSEDTIRRNLRELAAEDLLQCVHGERCRHLTQWRTFLAEET